MEDGYYLNESPEDRKHIENITADLGVDEPMIEEDWYAMRLMAVLKRFFQVDGLFTPSSHGGCSTYSVA